jgi:hypothetical protein
LGVGLPIIGGAACYVAKRAFELNRFMPQKTLDVLKGDKAWLQEEVRN